MLKSDKLIAQATAFGCGVACLKTVLAHCGIRPGPTDLRCVEEAAEGPISLASLLRAALHFGIEGRAVALDLEEFPLLRLPAILTWGRSHFVVLLSLSSEGPLIFDPLGKVFDASQEYLEDHFGGVALEFFLKGHTH